MNQQIPFDEEEKPFEELSSSLLVRSTEISAITLEEVARSSAISALISRKMQRDLEAQSSATSGVSFDKILLDLDPSSSAFSALRLDEMPPDLKVSSSSSSLPLVTEPEQVFYYFKEKKDTKIDGDQNLDPVIDGSESENDENDEERTMVTRNSETSSHLSAVFEEQSESRDANEEALGFVDNSYDNKSPHRRTFSNMSKGNQTFATMDSGYLSGNEQDNQTKEDVVESRTNHTTKRSRQVRESRSGDDDLVESTFDAVKCIGMDCYDIVQHCDIFRMFQTIETRDDDDYSTADSSDSSDPSGSLSNVTATVEAFVLAEKNVSKRKERDESKIASIHNHIVGIVRRCGDTEIGNIYGITPGERVASLLPSTSYTTRSVSIAPHHLVTVPKYLDAADAACTVAYYLPAFQALHHGRRRPYRYSKRCLKNQKIFITGRATSMLVQAIIKLAQFAGASRIFAIQKTQKEHNLLRKLKVITLSEDDWLDRVSERMDLIIDCNFPRDFDSVKEAMAVNGRVICFPARSSELSWFDRSKVSMMSGATIYDYEENVESYRDGLNDDLGFLFRLLEARQIRPKISKYISMTDMTLQSGDSKKLLRSSSGAIVCEPWKE